MMPYIGAVHRYRYVPLAQLDKACGYEPQDREFESLKGCHVAVAQLVRALDCGSSCRGFEFHQSPPKRPKQQFSIICFWYIQDERGLEMNKKIYKQAMKKTGDELQEWLQFKHRGSSVQAKKGKGSYSRKQKYKDREC